MTSFTEALTCGKSSNTSTSVTIPIFLTGSFAIPEPSAACAPPANVRPTESAATWRMRLVRKNDRLWAGELQMGMSAAFASPGCDLMPHACSSRNGKRDQADFLEILCRLPGRRRLQHVRNHVQPGGRESPLLDRDCFHSLPHPFVTDFGRLVVITRSQQSRFEFRFELAYLAQPFEPDRFMSRIRSKRQLLNTCDTNLLVMGLSSRDKTSSAARAGRPGSIEPIRNRGGACEFRTCRSTGMMPLQTF